MNSDLQNSIKDLKILLLLNSPLNQNKDFLESVSAWAQSRLNELAPIKKRESCLGLSGAVEGRQASGLFSKGPQETCSGLKEAVEKSSSGLFGATRPNNGGIFGATTKPNEKGTLGLFGATTKPSEKGPFAALGNWPTN